MPFSVIIIVKHRLQQLQNVLEAIERATIHPHDVQIVAMDDESYSVSSDTFPIHVHRLSSDETLPLAAARNFGAAQADTNTLIFIDVDCIVEPTLFEETLSHISPTTVITGYPLYLPYLPDNGVYEALLPDTVSHPERRTIPTLTPVEHTKFWSLIFAIHKDQYTKIGGFDESFIGYGGEDTDFAQSFHKAGLKLLFAPTHVIHQYHIKYDPPLNYFNAILKNAERYKEKWGRYAMYAWLQKFAAMGLITIEDTSLTVLRQPTKEEMNAQLSTEPY